MPQGHVLEFSGVTKRFGAVTAVSDFTARIRPGVVTGFLGPNGAGKSTTLRILLGLITPTAGSATIDGKPYAQLDRPAQTVGAVLEASSFHPGRTGRNHLKVYAQAAGVAPSRVDEVLALVGITGAADRKVSGYSLGMRQRLALATALLGDPGVLVLDEPTNGLDPEGITWVRGFLQALAREGRTVLVSSHMLAEVQQTADELVIISEGRLVFHGDFDDLIIDEEPPVIVDGPDRDALLQALTDAGISATVLRSGLTVRGASPTQVGAAAAAAGVPLSALVRRGPTLEDIFFDLVNGVRVHPSATGAGRAATAAVPHPTAESPVTAPDTTEPVTEAVPAAEPATEVAAREVPDEPIRVPADTAGFGEGVTVAAAAPGSAGAAGVAAAPAAAQGPEAATTDTPLGAAAGAGGQAALATARPVTRTRVIVGSVRCVDETGPGRAHSGSGGHRRFRRRSHRRGGRARFRRRGGRGRGPRRCAGAGGGDHGHSARRGRGRGRSSRTRHGHGQ
ncbi:ABC transporter ATP-binding protein [Microbacterium gorillae]|uniref:ABC transporter ATP-binding protein n=1 Tax=Microbacterium gorillae TaxID=1231063 RepID=UPI000AC21B0D|nr:ABC transporter ATP-binding protein [Microbacterium gorillae]